MFFVRFDPIMQTDTYVRTRRTTLEAIMLRFLFSSQFPHFTPSVLHSLIASTSSRLFILGNTLGFPLLRTQSEFFPTLGASKFAIDAACSLNPVQAV